MAQVIGNKEVTANQSRTDADLEASKVDDNADSQVAPQEIQEAKNSDENS